MSWSRRLLAIVALLVVPTYVGLDRAHVLPVTIRDRPWPFALVAVVLLAVAAARATRRARAVSFGLALGTTIALGWIAHERYRLPPSSTTTKLVGAQLPDIALPDEAGHLIRLRDNGQKPLLLIWFRGSWCPYCRRQLVDLAADIAGYLPLSFGVLGVTSDPPEPIAKMRRELALPFPILSDPQRQLVGLCELSHCVALTDASGVVRWAVLSGNWQKDLPAHALLQAAYRQQEAR